MAVLLAVGVGVLSVLNRHTELPTKWPVPVELVATAVILAFTTVGALVASRRPTNPVGWILLGAALSTAGSAFAQGYGTHALVTAPAELPGGIWAAWLSGWIYIPPLFAAPSLLFLLFPDGRLPGPRWRIVLWLLVAATVAATIDTALAPVLEDEPFAGLASPTGLGLPEDVLAPLSLFGWPGMLTGFVLAAVAMVRRLRRSRGMERHQLKWVASAAALLPPFAIIGVVAFYLGYPAAGSYLVYVGVLLIPLAAGYAVLRHRLYDIDLVVNRALVYGTLTAVLAGAYLGLVLVLGLALGPLTSGSDLTTAVSTLAVAGLFQPARRRVQALVDRRFYRRRYDAIRTIARFGVRLQARTDLKDLMGELTDVVRETMQPAHVSQWLRGGGP